MKEIHFAEDSLNIILVDNSIAEKMVLNHVVKEILEEDAISLITIINYKFSEEELIKSFKNAVEQNFLKQEDLGRIHFYEPLDRKMESLNSKINEEFKKDNIVILGVERLCIFTETESPHIENLTGETLLRLFTPEQLDISNKILEFNDWYKKSRGNMEKLILFFETTSLKSTQILSEFMDSNDFEITSIMNDLDEQRYVDIATIVKEISKKSLNESLTYVDNHKEQFSLDNILLMKFVAYIDKGYKEEALLILHENYSNLEYEQIIMYTTILNSQKYYAESYNILLPIYKKDKWLPGLLGALLISSRILSFEDREQLIKNVIEFIEDDLYLLQECANFFFKYKKYTDAGRIFRKIFVFNNDKYFDMLARVSELLSNPPDNVNVAESYLHAIVQEENTLTNEIYYRTALICKEIYKSDFKYYQNLKSIKINNDFIYSKEVVKKRLEILKNNDTIEKSIKLNPSIRERDLALVKELRIDEVLNGLEFLFLEDQGYWVLQEFINQAQSDSTWYSSIVKKLYKELDIWNTYSLEGIKESIELYSLDTVDEESDFNTILQTIRHLKMMEGSKQEKLEVVKGAIIMVSSGANVIEESLIRYEVSLYMSYIGEFQKANEHALVILNRFNREKNVENRNLLFALGIGAWATSQYKVGRKVDGVLCAIVAINKGLELNNYSILENAINILYLFINNDITSDNSLKNKFVEFRRRFNKEIGEFYDERLVEVENLLSMKKWDEANSLLKELLVDKDIQEVNDATNMVNYITTFIKLNKSREAYNLIKKHIWEILNSFEMRLDHRWKVILQFAHVVYSSPSFKDEKGDYFQDIQLCKEILKIAIGDIEKQRNDIFHIQERSAFSDSTKDVYKLYLDILLILESLQETPEIQKENLQKEIIHLVFSITPRTVVEQKFSNSEISDELNLKATQYFRLYDELLQLKPDIESADYAVKTKKFSELQDDLISQHSSFKSLALLEKVDINIIQKALKDDVYFQYCLTYYGLVSLLITKDHFKLSYYMGNFDEMVSILAVLGEELSESADKNTEKLVEIEEKCEYISEIIFKNLLTYIDNRKGTIQLIICPDMSIPYFTPSLIRDNKGWIINRLENLTNIVSPSEFNNRNKKKESFSNQNIISIGSKSNGWDKAIHIAKEWLLSNNALFNEILADFDGSNANLLDSLDKMKPKLLVFIGHGVEENGSGRNLGGAIKILGPQKRYLDSVDIDTISASVHTLFLLTCRSGQPVVHNIQSEQSVWKNIVSQKCNAILCRWDVDVNPGLFIIEEISKVDINLLSKELLTAQKKLLNGDRWNIPSAWACFEYWGLE